MRHFLAEPEDVSGDRITIHGADANHIRRVLRMKPGDKIEISAGAVGRYACAIESFGRGTVTARILEKREVPDTRLPAITLAQAVPKGRKMDDIVRMACELGVERIVPVTSERRVARPDEAAMERRLERWRKIAKAAAKQSRALAPCEIAPPADPGELAARYPANIMIVLWEEETATLKSVLKEHEEPGSILVLTGPEGGLDKREVERLKEQGFATASLGPKILRTETAGVAAVSAILYHYSP
ncbi:MAG: RsmE family RNA methyltransferase [Candidatus Nitrospinota bacterium M3_3B_026]